MWFEILTKCDKVIELFLVSVPLRGMWFEIEEDMWKVIDKMFCFRPLTGNVV